MHWPRGELLNCHKIFSATYCKKTDNQYYVNYVINVGQYPHVTEIVLCHHRFMQVSALLSQWGPALLVCFTVVIGLFYQNSRMNDLNSRISDLNTRMDDIKKSIDTRIDDLKLFIGAEFKRVDERIELMNRLVR